MTVPADPVQPTAEAATHPGTEVTARDLLTGDTERVVADAVADWLSDPGLDRDETSVGAHVVEALSASNLLVVPADRVAALRSHHVRPEPLTAPAGAVEKAPTTVDDLVDDDGIVRAPYAVVAALVSSARADGEGDGREVAAYAVQRLYSSDRPVTCACPPEDQRECGYRKGLGDAEDAVLGTS